MIPYSYNMVDMGGIDLAEANGTVVPGVYEKITEAINLCGDLILYNWKFAGIDIAPSAYTVLQQAHSILINGLIQVTELDQVTVIGLPPPIVPVSPLEATENGVYQAQPPASGFNPVTVALPPPVINPLEITENGEYSVSEGVDGFNPINVEVSGGIPLDDLLFHFDDFNNSGKMNAAFYNKTGYSISNEQSKFGGTSLKVSSAPSGGGAIYFDSGFTFGSQDFTLDFWIYTTSTASPQSPLSFNYRSLGLYMYSSTVIGFALARSSGSWSVDKRLSLEQSILNSWHHWAFVRNGNEFYTFIDGVKIDTTELSGSFPSMTRMSIGTNSTESNTSWRGYIDEFRLRLGTAIWTEDFTPPTEPYS